MSVALRNIYILLLPGILTAITGVGVGDLATAGFAGAQLGTAALWAVVVGALFKFTLTEGLARWQLATGTSIMQGAIEHLRWPFVLFMLFYFFPWCWFVGAALVNAAGVAGSELLQLLGFEVSKGALGVAHSLLALMLIGLGKQKYFGPLMSVLAALLFVTVLVCAWQLPLPAAELVQGLVPRLPADAQELSWIVALMGGVGGTLTIVCYGYWMAETGRSGTHGLRQNRWDLALSYLLTALFGMAMVIIGAASGQADKGLGLLIGIQHYFSEQLSPALGLCFLIGAWAAIFSSMLGVWQAVPQIFADCFYLLLGRPVAPKALIQTRAYRSWLLVLALVPLLSLDMSFKEVQKLYSLIGAGFMPVLALSLLYLNQSKWVAAPYRNGWLAQSSLITVFVFFSWVGWQALVRFIG